MENKQSSPVLSEKILTLLCDAPDNMIARTALQKAVGLAKMEREEFIDLCRGFGFTTVSSGRTLYIGIM